MAKLKHCIFERCWSRRIYTEEKANVVAAIWGTEFIQFLVALAIMHQNDLKNNVGPFHPFLHIILVQFILFFAVAISLLYKSFFYGADCGLECPGSGNSSHEKSTSTQKSAKKQPATSQVCMYSLEDTLSH